MVTGILFMFRSPGVAFNEAVVALQNDSNTFKKLRRFAFIISLAATVAAVAFVVSPLSGLWFSYLANLRVDLVPIARLSLMIGIALPSISMYVSLFQGVIVNQGKTNLIAEAVIVFLVIMGAVLAFGLSTGAFLGAYVASASFSAAHVAQCLWLLVRGRKNRLEILGKR